MSSSAALRSAEIARQLGMKPTSKSGNGRYLMEKTETEQIRVAVFHSYGSDHVGFVGSRAKRQWVIQKDTRWRRLGFQPHQAYPESAKNDATYIKKFAPLPDGKVNPELRRTYEWVLSEFKT